MGFIICLFFSPSCSVFPNTPRICQHINAPFYELVKKDVYIPLGLPTSINTDLLYFITFLGLLPPNLGFKHSIARRHFTYFLFDSLFLSLLYDKNSAVIFFPYTK